MNKIKISIEKLFLAIFLIVLSAYAIYFVSPGPDIYVHYLTAKEIIKDPSFLWRTNLAGWQTMLAVQGNVFIASPPLAYFFFDVLMLIGLPLFLATIASITAIGYFLYKINGLAIPFLFLSFMFVREIAFNGIDIIMVAVTLVSFYFLYKKKFIPSGILAAMTAIIKPTGFFVIFGWLLYVIYIERKKVFDKRILVTLLLMALVVAPWYLRNYAITKNVYFAIMGYTQDTYASSLTHLSTAFQMNQPERFIWDSTGYYPLPIDLLFYVGIFFFALNLIRTRKIQPYSIFVFIMVALYFIFQLSGIPFFVIRHEMIIFPFLALEIAVGIPKKYLKYVFVVCLIALVIFSYYLPKYAFNQYNAAIQPVFKQIKLEIDFEPVYINAFQGWFITYESGLNATIQNDSKWTLNFDQGQLYLTNKTNITGG